MPIEPHTSTPTGHRCARWRFRERLGPAESGPTGVLAGVCSAHLPGIHPSASPPPSHAQHSVKRAGSGPTADRHHCCKSRTRAVIHLSHRQTRRPTLHQFKRRIRRSCGNHAYLCLSGVRAPGPPYTSCRACPARLSTILSCFSATYRLLPPRDRAPWRRRGSSMIMDVTDGFS